MKLFFVTTNGHKFEEARAILSEHGIEIEQIDESYIEDKESSIQEIASSAAKQLAEKHQKPIIVEDTGIFFAAFKDFPGAHAKLMFNCLGYEGLLKLLAGTEHEAYFLTCVGFCQPGEKAQVFEGRLNGHITMVPYNLEKDVMPYERIFVPGNDVRTLSGMSREEKNKISHRSKAFNKLAEYLTKQM